MRSPMGASAALLMAARRSELTMVDTAQGRGATRAGRYDRLTYGADSTGTLWVWIPVLHREAPGWRDCADSGNPRGRYPSCRVPATRRSNAPAAFLRLLRT